MKRKRKSQSLVTSTPTKYGMGDNVGRAKSIRAKKSLSLVTSTPTKKKGWLRREFRAWRASLPTALEHDTLLMPDVIAESVVQEAERFLKADLPASFVERLAAKAHYLYPRRKHFQKMLKSRGNAGRDNLSMFMRHWTAAWLKREKYTLHKKFPWSYSLGIRLPLS
jgi:hypothetical protein